jgi:hypothetical protein
MVSNMSAIYSEQLNLVGARADKHDKVHEIYELSSEANVASQPYPTSQPAASGGNFDFNDDTRQRLTGEYAKYVGRSEAESVIQQKLGQASSVTGLCDLLAETLSEDDRYHFEEFTGYYGYR